MGGMNLFFVLGEGEDAELVTPELTGTLLPGITRDSLITLARELGHRVTERLWSVDEWRQGVADGTVTETFACGTAAVITAVGRARGPKGSWTIGDGEPGPVTKRLREELVGIQYGSQPDPHSWIHKLV
jgi:branched-chain amino acid aminotransferase